MKSSFARSFKVALFGASLTTGNMGVSALAVSTIGLVHRARPDAEVSFFIGHRNSVPQSVRIGGTQTMIPVVNFRLSPRAHRQEHALWILGLAVLWRVLPLKFSRLLIARSNRWINGTLETDLVLDISGGDSFSDIYGSIRYLVTAFPSIVAILLRKKVVFLPQTYGPFHSALSRIVARWILQRCDVIISRDPEPARSVGDVRLCRLLSQRASYCPDVAFSLEMHPASGDWLSPPIADWSSGPGPLIGMNVSGLLYHGGYSGRNMFGLREDYAETVRVLLAALIECTSARIALIPHHFGMHGDVNNDVDAADAVYSGLRKDQRDRLHVLRFERNQSELKGLIGHCDFFIGSRMHACIAALSQSIPAVGIAYSDKFRGVFRAVGLEEYVLDLRQVRTDFLIRKTMEAFIRRQATAKLLRVNLQAVGQKLDRTFSNLFGMDSVSEPDEPVI